MATATVTQSRTRGDTIELSAVVPAPSADQTGQLAPKNEQAAYSQGKLTKGTYLKLISAGFSFFVAGVNDGSIGALLPYIIREYNINTAIVSSV